MKVHQFLVLLLLTLLGARANSQNQLSLGSRLWPENKHFSSTLAQPAQPLNGNWRLDSIHCEAPAGAAWLPQTNDYYLYDAQGRLSQTNRIAWDVELEKWRPDSRTFFHYAGAGTEVSETLTLTWSADLQDWGNDTSRVRNLYTNGRISQIFSETYDVPTGAWHTDSREDLLYDTDGKLLQRSGYLLNDDETDWVLFGELLYAYNGDLPISETFSITLDGGMNWQTFYQTSHTYQNGLLKETITQIIDFQSGGLAPSDRAVFSYDDRDLNVHTDNYYWDDTAWLPDNRCDLFYGTGGVLAAPAPVVAQELQLANPFPGGAVQLTGENAGRNYELTIFDMHAAPIFRNTSPNGRWQLPALPAAGVYVLLVREEGRVVARREIVSVR